MDRRGRESRWSTPEDFLCIAAHTQFCSNHLIFLEMQWRDTCQSRESIRIASINAFTRSASSGVDGV